MRDRYRQRIAKHTPCACQTALVAKNLGCSGNFILQNSLPQLENETYKLLHPERNQRRSSVFLQDFRIKNFSKIVCACPEHENFLIISLLGEFFVFIFSCFSFGSTGSAHGEESSQSICCTSDGRHHEHLELSRDHSGIMALWLFAKHQQVKAGITSTTKGCFALMAQKPSHSSKGLAITA